MVSCSTVNFLRDVADGIEGTFELSGVTQALAIWKVCNRVFSLLQKLNSHSTLDHVFNVVSVYGYPGHIICKSCYLYWWYYSLLFVL